MWLTKPSRYERPGGGRDHLGLTGIDSFGVLAQLLPELNVVTTHPRYQSFYLFVLDEYWKDEKKIASPTEYAKFFRPHEYVHSLACFMCEQPTHPAEMSNVNGAGLTRGKAMRREPSYRTDVDYMDNPLGGWGYYYRSVAAGLGLILPGGRGLPSPIDRPTLLGRQLAEHFRESVADTSYYISHFDSDEMLLDDIVQYAQVACLCRTADPRCSDHDLLLDVFLHSGRAAEARRRSMRLYLNLLADTQGHRVDDETFRQLLYFGESSEGAHWQPDKDLLEWRECWRLWQAREYVSLALSSMWSYLCRWGESNHGITRPIRLEEFRDHLREGIDLEALASQVGISGSGLDSTSSVHDLDLWQARYGANPLSPSSQLAESSLATTIRQGWSKSPNPNANVLAPLLMLLAVSRLPAGLPANLAAEFRRAGQGDGISLDQLASWVESQSLDDTPIFAAAYDLTERIIRLHLRVALSKLPRNTFRFQREDGGLRFFGHSVEVDFASSRYESLSTHIRELGLASDPLQADHPLTEEGLRFLREGDL